MTLPDDERPRRGIGHGPFAALCVALWFLTAVAIVATSLSDVHAMVGGSDLAAALVPFAAGYALGALCVAPRAATLAVLVLAAALEVALWNGGHPPSGAPLGKLFLPLEVTIGVGIALFLYRPVAALFTGAGAAPRD